MDWLQEVLEDKELKSELLDFIERHGKDGLKKAIQNYADAQFQYICKSRTSISKIKIDDIFYLEIKGHNISIYTMDKVYSKYGSLTREVEELIPYGFLKCNQSILVALNKIHAIEQNKITLMNGMNLHMSRSCAPKIVMAFTLGNRK